MRAKACYYQKEKTFLKGENLININMHKVVLPQNPKNRSKM